MSILANVLNQQCLHFRVWQEDGMFIAKCLDIPGCVSEGATREEAMANINEAIGLCLEVIAEDAGCHRLQSENTFDVDVIERPISEFFPTANRTLTHGHV